MNTDGAMKLDYDCSYPDILSSAQPSSDSKNNQNEKNENNNNGYAIPKVFRRNETVTLSKVSIFHDPSIIRTEEEQKGEKQSTLNKIRQKALKFIDGIYFHIMVILASLYSLFMADIRMLAVPPRFDTAFHHVNEAIFFFFLTEFIVILLIKKHFIKSFFFYLDIISLFSLLPETPLIWNPLISVVAGNISKLNEVLSNSHLAKTSRASQAGSRASNYLRLLRLINFIKIIRVAKMVEETKILNRGETILENPQKTNKNRYRKRQSLMDTIEKFTKLSQVPAINKMKPDIIDEQKQEDDGGEGFISTDHKRLEDDNEKSNFNKFQAPIDTENAGNLGELSPIQESHERERDAIPNEIEKNQNEIHVIYPTLQKMLKEQANIKRGSNYKIFPGKNQAMKGVGIHFSPIKIRGKEKDSAFRRVSTSKYQTGSNKLKLAFLREKEQAMALTHMNKLKRSATMQISLFSNEDELHIAKRLSQMNPYYLHLYNEVLKKHEIEADKDNESSSSSESSDSQSDWMNASQERKIQNLVKEKMQLATNRNWRVLEKEKEIAFKTKEIELNNVENQIANFRKIENERKFKNEEEFPLKDKKSEIDLINKFARNLSSKLEKKMSSGITQKVVVMVMILLVGLPIIDLDFMFPLVFSSEITPEMHDDCIDLIYSFLNRSIHNQSYLTGLNMTITSCFYAPSPDWRKNTSEGGSEIIPEVQRFILINFTECDIFHILQNQTFFFGNKTYVSIPDLHEFEKNYREEDDYQTDNYTNGNCNIQYVYDNRMYNKVSSITGIIKSSFVATLLVLSAYIFSKNVSNLVISPLDKIFTKLNLNLKHVYIDEKEQISGNQLLAMDREPEDNKNNFTIFENTNLEGPDKFNSHKTEEVPSQQNSVRLNKNSVSVNNAVIMGKSSILSGHVAIDAQQREIDYIDMSLKKLLDLVSLSIGKAAYLLIPNSDLEKKLRLNLKSPGIKYEGLVLLLQLTNTDEFLRKYKEHCPYILNKVYSLFHSVGIIFNGEPYFKDNINAIIFQKEKHHLSINLNRYSIGLVTTRKSKIERLTKEMVQIVSSLDKSRDTFFDSIIYELAVLCGMKFLFLFQKNLRETNHIFQETGVKVNVYISGGDIYHGFVGTKDALSEEINGPAITKTLHFSTKLIPHSHLPSLIIDESVYDNLHLKIRKFICAYESVFIEDEKKVQIMYRHYLNYSIFQKPALIFKHIRANSGSQAVRNNDTLNISKLKPGDVFKERKTLEKNILKCATKEDFILNFFENDDNYLDMTSNFFPLLKNLLYESLKGLISFNYEECLKSCKDIQELNLSPTDTDPIIASQLIETENAVMTVLTENSGKNYTKIV